MVSGEFLRAMKSFPKNSRVNQVNSVHMPMEH